ncbi:hypothetical protein BD324DRAFT_650041 [Kockovaella imperatae]|uniref:Uncharacterized protein n=1 Tax=Kockovaella imperatae TaxID=4999 RepID=A0A1Y1UMK0_9TREE|nr:hypothetical protein BD324DRAFT_650041 [Kockovaella imperatae]ORX38696.1 hypothetical protein BD324DRAFT_650041 [Kockovaella imperatae]
MASQQVHESFELGNLDPDNSAGGSGGDSASENQALLQKRGSSTDIATGSEKQSSGFRQAIESFSNLFGSADQSKITVHRTRNGEVDVERLVHDLNSALPEGVSVQVHEEMTYRPPVTEATARGEQDGEAATADGTTLLDLFKDGAWTTWKLLRSVHSQDARDSWVFSAYDRGADCIYESGNPCVTLASLGASAGFFVCVPALICCPCVPCPDCCCGQCEDALQD